MGRKEFETASVSPTQNMRTTQKANCMIAFEDVAKNIARGTSLRGSSVSSTAHIINVDHGDNELLLLTHMKDTVETTNGVSSGKHAY